MIAPGAVVGDVDALFALSVGADEGAVDVDQSLSKNSTGCWADALAGAVDGIHEIHHSPEVPATAAARSGEVGDSLNTEVVETSLVVSEPFDVGAWSRRPGCSGGVHDWSDSW